LKERTRKYFKENPGAPFILAFMVTLMLSAVLLIVGNDVYANVAATCGYFSLVIGVILQLVSFIRSSKRDSNQKLARIN
jgi:hypothetical protein